MVNKRPTIKRISQNFIRFLARFPLDLPGKYNDKLHNRQMGEFVKKQSPAGLGQDFRILRGSIVS
jgi:hypothetical protein